MKAQFWRTEAQVHLEAQAQALAQALALEYLNGSVQVPGLGPARSLLGLVAPQSR